MMKKLLIFFIVSIISVSYVNSQSLELSYEGNILGDTVYIYDKPESTEVTFFAKVKNISDRLISVKVARTNIEVMESTSNQMYFAGQQYGPGVDTTINYLPLISGGISNDDQMLKANYFHEGGIIGETIVKYSFFDKSKPSDHTDVVVVFWTSPTSVGENLFNQISFSNIYPNPATNNINIDYNFDTNINNASLKIVNLLGSVVKEVEIDQNSNKLSMDISNLDAGVYFYSIVVNNEVFQTKKLVIR